MASSQSLLGLVNQLQSMEMTFTTILMESAMKLSALTGEWLNEWIYEWMNSTGSSFVIISESSLLPVQERFCLMATAPCVFD